MDAVCRAALSEARARQIRAHAREPARALKHPDHPPSADDDPADVVACDCLKAYERPALRVLPTDLRG